MAQGGTVQAGGGSKAQAKRAVLVARIADALLAQGVAQIALRDLADELGTSDRMLLYYFDDKADLVLSSLGEVSARLAAGLDAAFPLERRPPAMLFQAVIDRFDSGAMAPFMAVWADVTARSGRGEEPFRAFAQAAIGGWLQWLDDRLDLADAAARRTAATAILVVVEGARQLETSSPGCTRAVGDFLVGSFAEAGRGPAQV